MSKPETISGFKVDASTNCLKQIAGLKFANNFNSFLNFKSALSGFLENSKLSADKPYDHQQKLSGYSPCACQGGVDALHCALFAPQPFR